MRKPIAVLILCVLLALCGCASHYVISLDNGRRITTASKPHLQNGAYVFKDALGHQNSIPASRVREIAPASMANDNKGKGSFNAQPSVK